MVIEQVGMLGSFLFLAVALSMDAFSVSLSIGLQKVRLRKAAIIGFVIGIFHILLPFIGMVIGGMISMKLEKTASVVGAFILIFIGLHIFFSSFSEVDKHKHHVTSAKLLTLAFVVSMDSFPVGLSLGLSGVHVVFVFVMFGIVSMLFAWLGILIGRKVHTHLSKYSEMFGGIILFVIGMFLLF